MLNYQIIKTLPALFLIALSLTASNCSFFGARGDSPIKDKDALVQPTSLEYGKPQRIATIEDADVRESSGIVASRKNEGIFWTHNDSGDNAFLYAFDRAGKKRGTFRVTGANNVDWEDIAIYSDRKTGKSYLFIGDIGDNKQTRNEIVIYRVAEPEIRPEDANTTKKKPRATEKAEAIRLKYPDEKRDAETLLLHPVTGDLYILSKNMIGDADVYKLAAPFSAGKTRTLQHVGKYGVPSLTRGFLTGGDISPDGKRVVLSDYFAAYEIVLPTKAKHFDEIWKEKARAVSLGEREQGEAVSYSADGNAILATSEKKNSPLIEVRRK